MNGGEWMESDEIERDGIRARIPRSVVNVFIEPRLGLDGDCDVLKILVAGPDFPI